MSATVKYLVSPRSNTDDNRADPTGDAIMKAVALLRQTIDYSHRQLGKMRATITIDFVSFGCEGDREPPRVEVEWHCVNEQPVVGFR